MAYINNILNNDQIKAENRQAVLKLLCKQGPMSRAELSSNLNCDGTTITNITRHLLEKGLVKSLGFPGPAKTRGRPKELLSLNEDYCRVLGISFEPWKLIGIVTDFIGNIIYQERVHFDKNIKKSDLEKLFVDLAGGLVSRSDEKELLGLGLAVSGIYSREKKTIIYAKNLPAVCGIDFDNLFREFGLKPEAINLVYADGISEYWNKKEIDIPDSFIYISADIGIGTAIFLNSQPFLTAKGYYNEFGHSVLVPDGEKCEAGHRGCLETLAAVPALEKKLKEQLDRSDINFDYVREKYLAGDKVVVKVVNESAKWLGVATANLINLFAPDEVILSGMIAELGQEYLNVFRQSVKSYAIKEFCQGIFFKLSETDQEGPALGAAINLIRKFMSSANGFISD